MAITINGTGTITGISAGGLPDGSVVAADLASTLDLTGKTVTLPTGTGGKVLQVVSATQSTEASRINDTSRFDTGLTASITPSSTSSKVLIIVTQSLWTLNGTNNTTGRCHLMRGSTDLVTFVQRAYAGSSTAFAFGQHITGHYMDSPASTAALTYKTQINIDSSTSASVSAQGNQETSFIVLMEVAG